MSHYCECPYCEDDVEINHDDGYGYAEDEVYQQQCGSCGKTFIFTTSISYSYDAQQADCLNDGKHDWKLSNTYPKCCSRMVCTMCDEHRELTAKEKIEHKMPTYAEEMAKLNDKK